MLIPKPHPHGTSGTSMDEEPTNQPTYQPGDGRGACFPRISGFRLGLLKLWTELLDLTHPHPVMRCPSASTVGQGVPPTESCCSPGC